MRARARCKSEGERRKEGRRVTAVAAVRQNIRRAYVIVPINKLEGPDWIPDDGRSLP